MNDLLFLCTYFIKSYLCKFPVIIQIFNGFIEYSERFLKIVTIYTYKLLTKYLLDSSCKGPIGAIAILKCLFKLYK